ncbi:hypothetical protein N825_16090 [Skermanella stibiiresistens SB22]|uniref:Ketohydroxyglutarate aldolase n=1 Tax=Skermanella stibiiresistens SB22 TaxID=1385369 RepID=W9GZN7_9PROT|nr:hypothetical protein [Skermanella stibiiresistens]EWY37922.1 hypothetical protein N825_16090 [Skermanella stibiiresistens SB22]
MPKITVNVLIADDKMDKFDEVIRACRRAGLQVEQEMPLTGTVTGLIESDVFDSLREIEGVSAVEVSRHIRTPPPIDQIQ